MKWKKLALALAISSVVAGLRQLGIFQYWEWQGIDLMFQLRPTELVDERIIIVGFNNKDMRALGDSRLSDAQIARLIEIIKQGKPRAIGLDIFRDHLVGSGHEDLMEVFRTTPNLYGIGKQTGIKGDPDYDIIEPPPIPKAQITDVSVSLDGDDVQRRAFLYPVTKKQQIPSLGLILAYEYLYAEGISAQKSIRGGLIDLGKATFYRFKNQTGPYVRTDDKSYQIFMNWRKAPFKVVSVTEVLSGKVSPQIFKERLVIVGGFAPKLGDQFLTPFNRGIWASPRKIYGSEAQAQLSSMVISAAIDERPLVKVWHEPWISLGILGWGGITFLVLSYFSRQWVKILIFLVGSSGLLGMSSYLAFLEAIWIPLIPALIVLWTVGIILSGFDYECGRRKDYQKIRQLNQDLKKANQKLEKKLEYRQFYKDNALQYRQTSQRIYPALENALNILALLEKHTEILSQSLQNSSAPNRSPETLAKMSVFLNQQKESLDSICTELAKSLPNLEKLLPSDLRQIVDKFLLAEAIRIALDSLRPDILKEYQIDILQQTSLKLDFNQEIFLENLDKLVILLSRIFDEIFLLCQLNNWDYPAVKIHQYKNEIELIVLRVYQPKELNILECEERISYYGGTLSVVTKKDETCWRLTLLSR